MSHPYYDPTVHGDVLSRLNLYRFIREHLYHGGAGEGYYLEFGVFNGDSMWEAYQSLRGLVSHYVGFDSFEGLPELSQADQAAKDLQPFWDAGTVKGDTRDRVYEGLVARGIPRDRLTLVEGFYEASLPATPPDFFEGKGPCHVCLVDCDLYSSSKQVFEFVEPHLTTGTWLLLDDYWCYRGSGKHGQQRAFREWLEGSDRITVQEWGNFRGWGKAFLVDEV
ncbi:MAG: class I SAM-dependent methyltransferase [bacterium]|nr:class I SAM-dependent methyltransferase [bacterium]